MKKPFGIIALILAMALLLSACGQKQETPAAAAPTENKADEPTVNPADTDFTGNWYIVSEETNVGFVTLNGDGTMVWAPVTADDQTAGIAALNDAGKMVWTVTAETTEGTWKKTDTGIELAIGEKTLPLNIGKGKDKKAILENSERGISLTRMVSADENGEAAPAGAFQEGPVQPKVVGKRLDNALQKDKVDYTGSWNINASGSTADDTAVLNADGTMTWNVGGDCLTGTWTVRTVEESEESVWDEITLTVDRESIVMRVWDITMMKNEEQGITLSRMAAYNNMP